MVIRIAKHFQKLAFIALLGLMTSIQNCDEEDVVHTFKWIASGNILTYDLNMPGNRIQEYRLLEISEESGGGERIVFEERVPLIPSDPFGQRLLLGMFLHAIAKADGIYTTTCLYCNLGACFTSKAYSKVPKGPSLFQQIPDYACGENVSSHDVVLSVDSIVLVPLGEFHTIAILDSVSQTVKFWNEETGLIRVDNFSIANSDTITLELSAKNY